MQVTIVDYGIGNLWSVKNAFEFLGAEVLITSDLKKISSSRCLILPGVGNFGAGMKNLQSLGLISALNDAVLSKGATFLGICLGMHLLADGSEEAPGSVGLGWIPGTVCKLDSNNVRLPHVGFSEISVQNDKLGVFSNKKTSSLDFYFVHSYYFQPAENKSILGWTEYGNKFVSAVCRDKIYGVQFHPEKSQSAGLQFISNFLKVAAGDSNG